MDRNNNNILRAITDFHNLRESGRRIEESFRDDMIQSNQISRNQGDNQHTTDPIRRVAESPSDMNRNNRMLRIFGPNQHMRGNTFGGGDPREGMLQFVGFNQQSNNRLPDHPDLENIKVKIIEQRFQLLEFKGKVSELKKEQTRQKECIKEKLKKISDRTNKTIQMAECPKKPTDKLDSIVESMEKCSQKLNALALQYVDYLEKEENSNSRTED